VRAQEFEFATVVLDNDGDAWVRIGPDLWCVAPYVSKGVKYAERYSASLAEIEAAGYGPLAIEWRIDR
jgi:hypothetical protein